MKSPDRDNGTARVVRRFGLVTVRRQGFGYVYEVHGPRGWYADFAEREHALDFARSLSLR